MEKAVAEMAQIHERPVTELIMSNGLSKQAELVSSAINEMYDRQHRFVAGIDLAGYLLTFKALQNTPLLEKVRYYDPNIRSVTDKTKQLNLTDDPNQIISRALHWVINNPAARVLHYHGDINQLVLNENERLVA